MSRLMSGYIDPTGARVIAPTLRTATRFCSGPEKVIMWQRLGNPFEVPSMPGIAHPMPPMVVINPLERES